MQYTYKEAQIRRAVNKPLILIDTRIINNQTVYITTEGNYVEDDGAFYEFTEK